MAKRVRACVRQCVSVCLNVCFDDPLPISLRDSAIATNPMFGFGSVAVEGNKLPLNGKIMVGRVGHRPNSIILERGEHDIGYWGVSSTVVPYRYR